MKIIAPVPAGGGVDLLSRAIAQKLQEQWNQSVVVENKPGASALIGTDFVAKSTDGHTLLMGYSVLATNKYLVGKLPYDLEQRPHADHPRRLHPADPGHAADLPGEQRQGTDRAAEGESGQVRRTPPAAPARARTCRANSSSTSPAWT